MRSGENFSRSIENPAKYCKRAENFTMTGNSSPVPPSHQHSKTLSSDFLDKTHPEIQLSKLRLQQRKKERIQIQTVSKQLQLTSNPDFFPVNKPNPESRINQNLWTDLKNVPASKLKHVLPFDVRANDLKGLNSIIARGQVEQKIRETLEDQKQVNKIKSRLFNIQRHSYFMKLEQRSGIAKVRNRDVDQGVFGYIKSYKISPRLLSLSNPHKITYNEFDKSDYKGLISKDYPSIIKDLNQGSFPINSKPKVENSSIEETIQSILDFEKKLSLMSNQ